MSTAAEWADTSEAGADPLFGGRRTWPAYTYETTGYGSLELRGARAYRVTIVHPDDRDALRRHHRLVRSGRLNPAPYRRRRIDPAHLRVIDREELSGTRADAVGSWLSTTQRVAHVCGADDEVARLAGPALRQILWVGRDHLGTEHVAAALAELRRATEELAAERRRYCVALDRWVASGRRPQVETRVDPETGPQLVQGDIESIRLETRVLVAVQREWTPT
ncbi:MAG: hypothetical protein ABWX74_06970 [Aeromicrobium sp.]